MSEATYRYYDHEGALYRLREPVSIEARQAMEAWNTQQQAWVTADRRAGFDASFFGTPMTAEQVRAMDPGAA